MPAFREALNQRSAVPSRIYIGHLYFIKNCKSLVNPDVSTKCLWRRTSPYLDDKVDEGGTESVLIEGVTKFELRYFGKEKEDWVDSWDSTTENDDSIKNKFPSAVEVTLTIEQNKKLYYINKLYYCTYATKTPPVLKRNASL